VRALVCLLLAGCGFVAKKGPSDLAVADASSDDAAVDAACSPSLACVPYASVNPDGATLRDVDSERRAVALACGGTWSACGLQETCADDGGARCASCGLDAARRGYRTVDGVVVDDCVGCACHAWYILGCYADFATYGSPWVDLVWQEGSHVLRFAVTTGMMIIPTGFGVGDHLSNLHVVINQMNIFPGGTVDIGFDLDDDYVDNFGAHHAWHLAGEATFVC
jgi:hypothetical protein